MKTQGQLLSPALERQTGKYRKSWLTETETHKKKPPGEPVLVEVIMDCN